MDFSIIVALSAKTGGIGVNNGLPWKLPIDMKYFKQLTTTSQHGTINVVIMGRKTWESIPTKFKPLENRLNIIISSNSQLFENTSYQNMDNIILHSSLSNALNYIKQLNSHLNNIHKIFVIGGYQLYKEALESKLCKYLYVTEVYLEHDNEHNYDIFFPNLVLLTNKYQCIQQGSPIKDNKYTLMFNIYQQILN